MLFKVLNMKLRLKEQEVHRKCKLNQKNKTSVALQSLFWFIFLMRLVVKPMIKTLKISVII